LYEVIIQLAQQLGFERDPLEDRYFIIDDKENCFADQFGSGREPISGLVSKPLDAIGKLPDAANVEIVFHLIRPYRKPQRGWLTTIDL